MKVAVKKVDNLRREMNFEISKERVSKALDEVYKNISKSAKIKGYRPGKAPRHVLEAHHGQVAKEEVINKLIPEVYQEGIKQESIVPIDLPEIVDVSLKEGILKFKAKLDIKPDVKIKKYKGLKVKRKDSKVTDDDINKTLEYFKQGAGDKKDVKIDDEFAKGLGYPNLADLKTSISRQLEMDKDRQNRIDVENQIVDALLKNSQLDVPQSLVERQKEHRINDFKKRLKEQGLSDEDIMKREVEVRKDLDTAVQRDIKVYLILEKIVALEKIDVKEGENMPQRVIELLLKEAAWE